MESWNLEEGRILTIRKDLLMPVPFVLNSVLVSPTILNVGPFSVKATFFSPLKQKFALKK